MRPLRPFYDACNLQHPRIHLTTSRIPRSVVHLLTMKNILALLFVAFLTSANPAPAITAPVTSSPVPALYLGPVPLFLHVPSITGIEFGSKQRPPVLDDNPLPYI